MLAHMLSNQSGAWCAGPSAVRFAARFVDASSELHYTCAKLHVLMILGSFLEDTATKRRLIGFLLALAV